MKPNFFFDFFFTEKVAQEPAQLLAETWCPYLLWVLRNLPHKFEKLAHVTKSAKKNVTIWASRSARAPKNTRQRKFQKLDLRQNGMTIFCPLQCIDCSYSSLTKDVEL